MSPVEARMEHFKKNSAMDAAEREKKSKKEEEIVSGSTIVDEIKAKREKNAAAEAAKKAEADAAEEKLYQDIEAARQRIAK